jgi:DNA invertase Pin-like site-specific DNA recombinase
MNSKITLDHLNRGAAVYIRQSSMAQVLEHTESKRRQYALADSANSMGFASVATIDDDLGRSGSGAVERPGFQKLVAFVCSDSIGAVFCIEASRLARNGRDWHHLIDLCALVGTLIIDPDGVYDPRLVNDRLLLGLKGSMSEYELSLLRQRSQAARDSKAKRGELRFSLPPGYCWDELGQIEMDPDERIRETIHLIFRKFRELGSIRQAFLWIRQATINLPVIRPGSTGYHVEWRTAAYHTLLQLLQHPIYAGAYVFGRRSQLIQVVDGRARKTEGHFKPMQNWNVLLRNHHPGYISWEEFEENQNMIAENAHMLSRTARKSARGGRALLTGLTRCGRCGRMMRVFYASKAGEAHRYQCTGDKAHIGGKLCIGVGGARVDRAVATRMLEAVSPLGVEAAIQAAERFTQADQDVRQALTRELEEARYDASLAARRYEVVDPTKRLVARELEARWNVALERVAELEKRLGRLQSEAARRPQIDRAGLMELAHDLPSAWNAPTTSARTRQRLTRILIQEVVMDLDDAANEAVVTVHWSGGRHTEIRVARRRDGPYPEDQHPSPVEVIRNLGDQWPDRELAVTMNRMRCKANDGQSWTTLRVRELRERLGIPAFDPATPRAETVTMDEAAHRLQISVGSIIRLIRRGIIPATQLMPSAPWQIPVVALDSEAVKTGVRDVIARRPLNITVLKQNRFPKLPGL